MKINLSEIKESNVEFVKNLLAFITGHTITFQEYIMMECQEIFGDENKWFAGENLRHPPTNIDCQRNYIGHEADKLFHQRCHYLVERNWQKNIKKFMLYIYSNFKNFSNSIRGMGRVAG